eukprot:gene6092-7057_t
MYQLHLPINPTTQPTTTTVNSIKQKFNLNLSNIRRSLATGADECSGPCSPSSPTSAASGLRSLFSINSPRRSPRVKDALNLQSLPIPLIDHILSQVLDFVLPSNTYVELMLVSHYFARVIESMRGFVVVVGISTPTSAAMLRWYKRNHMRVSSIKFINNFFTTPFSRIFLNAMMTLNHCPSLDLSYNIVTRDVVAWIITRLKKSPHMHSINLGKVTFAADVSQTAVDELLSCIAASHSMQRLEMGMIPQETSLPLVDNAVPAVPLLYTVIPRVLCDNHALTRLDIGGMGLLEVTAKSLSEAIAKTTSLHTLVYNNNPSGVRHILEALAINRSITQLDLGACQIFRSSENVSLFANVLRSNTTISHLDLNRNTFNLIPNAATTVFAALALNETIVSLDLSHTSTSFADNNLFPLLQQLYTRNTTIHTLNLNNNCPFPDASAFAASDFLSDNTTLTCLSLSNLKLSDDKFASLIAALSRNRSLVSLDLSINRLRLPSALAIAAYLENNDHLVELNLAYNFLRTGVKNLCMSLHNNTTLRTLNLYATQIHSRESKALAKLLSHNRTITELDIGYNLQIDPILSALENNTNIKTLHLRDTSIKNSFVKLIQRNQAITTMDISNSSFTTWKASAIANALLKSRTLSKINFSTREISMVKVLSLGSRVSVKLLPNKFYYFK